MIEEYTVEAIRRALARDPRVGELELDVEVDEEAIRVTGTLPTEQRRDAVTEVLEERFPNHRVENATAVLSPEAPPDEEVVG
ncbi:MAG TPA: phospholipid-binding protein [Actinomycetota bacterium]|nr:phospholipid-binding protein [Actinomycetota bacterium]